MSDGGDCRTAPATPGLLNMNMSYVLRKGYLHFYNFLIKRNCKGRGQKTYRGTDIADTRPNWPRGKFLIFVGP